MNHFLFTVALATAAQMPLPLPPSGPIIIPLHAGLNNQPSQCRLTSLQDGVKFDLNADDTAEQTAWTAADSGLAFLALDRNGDGVINNGSELFGSHTLPGVNNGFIALSRMGYGGGNLIDYAAPLYEKLLLWEDRNHNGISEPTELSPFSERYTGISGGFVVMEWQDKLGNPFRYRSVVEVRTAPGPNIPANGAEQGTRLRDVYAITFQ
jgi:hypothetical protein